VVVRRQKVKYTGCTQKNGAVSKVNKKFISHLTQAQHTPSAAAATVEVSRALNTILQCMHPRSHDTNRKPSPAATPSWKLVPRGPAVSIRSELAVAHEKLGQLPLLTVYVVPV